MAKMMSFCSFISLCLLPWLLALSVKCAPEEYQTYIIYMDHSQKPASFENHESWHRSTLQSLAIPVDHQKMLLYSYSHVMNGFSVRLTPSQLSEIEKSPAHLATYPESFGKLFTTHSPRFLGLNQKTGLWPAASYGEGVIIGLVDSGIWPESESFSDKGMPPVPQRWKGKCENGTGFSSSACNRKLIGAQLFSKGIQASGRISSDESTDDSARDFLGHGSHTSSTAAGNYVHGTSHFGYAKGTARGVAPRAHVAMYKVTLRGDSAASDVLAAMDQAIADGVDVLSLSLGFDNTPYFMDVIAIGSLSAIEKGITVVCAAGNFGAYNSTHNGAPWIMTVGAGTMDRSFTGTVTLGNEFTYEGISYFPEGVYITDAPLYYGNDNIDKATCNLEALREDEIAGKVVICDNTTLVDIDTQMAELDRVGAFAGILMADKSDLDPAEFYVPSLILPTAVGALVREYAIDVNNNSVVKTMSFGNTRLGTQPAPQVAFFSSRGPDPINPGILKPDVLAPGVDVLAAVVPNIPFMEVGNYDLVTDYALYSGTSMAAPHVAGVSALLKAVHPEWSPAAIRSAIMTTAYKVDNTGTRLKDQLTGLTATPLDTGTGHVNPNKAMDPGLIYDMGVQDYIDFLCGIGYTEQQMKAVLRRSQWNCGQVTGDLNYPSFVAIFSNGVSSKNFSRVVTNVGDYDSVYSAVPVISTGMVIRVEPSTLTFTQKYEKQSFTLSVEVDKEAPPMVFGHLTWVDQYNHVVSSPIVVLNF